MFERWFWNMYVGLTYSVQDILETFQDSKKLTCASGWARTTDLSVNGRKRYRLRHGGYISNEPLSVGIRKQLSPDATAAAADRNRASSVNGSVPSCRGARWRNHGHLSLFRSAESVAADCSERYAVTEPLRWLQIYIYFITTRFHKNW